MNAVKNFNAEELGDMSKNDISRLVGDKEGKKLFSQLTVEKSGDCWHVSELTIWQEGSLSQLEIPTNLVQVCHQVASNLLVSARCIKSMQLDICRLVASC